MKKSILFSMALVAALSSCTKDNVDNNNENNDLVAIQFGAGIGVDVDAQVQKASRAPLEDWADTPVGMFVLAKNADADYAAQTATDVLWSNVSASIATGGAATPTLAGQPKYYPNGGNREFSFYGYHPYDDSDVTFEAKEVTRTFTITGNEDILWGKAEVEGGYNAPYFRANEGVVPDVKFNHLLSQLKFKIQASDKFEEGQTLTVTKLEIVKVPTSLTLNVVAGTLVPGQADQTITVYNDDVDGTDITNGTGETELGSPVMLYSSNDRQSYQIVLTTKDADGNVSTSPSITIAPTTTANFAVGTAYNVILTLNSNKTIEFTATLSKWTPGEDVKVEI